MKYSAFPSQEVQAIQRSVEQTTAIRTTAIDLAARLHTLFEQRHPKSKWGVEIDVSDIDCLKIKTPYGLAQARLQLYVENTKINGRYLIERQSTDSYGRPLWQEVWAFQISPYGEITHGDGGEYCFEDDQFDEAEKIGYLAMSIIYAISKRN